VRSRLKSIVCAVILVAIGLLLLFGFRHSHLAWLHEIFGTISLIGAWLYIRSAFWRRRSEDTDEAEHTGWPAGDWSVELVSPGPLTAQVIGEIRRLTGLSSDEAAALLVTVPSVVLADVNGRTAHDAQAALEALHAQVRLTWPEDAETESPIDARMLDALSAEE
jgi:ribosomal protein L7/L12